MAGCATPPAPPPAEPPPENVAEPASPPADKYDFSRPLKHLAGRKLQPIPTRPLNAKGDCTFRDPNGYRGKIQLQVKEALVQRFAAQVDVPKKGSCQFDLKNFQQVESLPQVRLAAADGCSVRMWEQDKKITVAFAGCQAQCSGDAVDYLWPIQLDSRRCF
ncbi:MAG: hypothetical protein KGN39_00300 [Betaproteobacteria bacterium]|nr:hypothetical protein [Betaproteobacteria bacterium]